MPMSPGAVFILPIAGLPEIHAGDNLGALLVQALMRTEIGAQPGDILVVTHKIVAKAEGALVDLRTVEPSSFALSFAAAWSKDPRQVEVVLRHTKRIVRMDHGVIISETQHGLICANAGVDQSNIEGEDVVCVLPDDPDRSAQQIAETVREMTGHELGVIVSDTFGRPWREGLTNVAIGVAGIRPLRDYIGMKDAQGRTLKVTALAIADELAGAAELVMGKLDRIPAAIIRGYQVESGAGSSRELLRKPELDMFR